MDYKTRKDRIQPRIPVNTDGIIDHLSACQRFMRDLTSDIRDDMESGEHSIQVLAASPTVGLYNGYTYFNSADSKIYVYYGGGWLKTAALT